MKVLFILLLVISSTVIAQKPSGVSMLLAGGMSNRYGATGVFGLGGQSSSGTGVSMNLQVFSQMRSVMVPVVTELRLSQSVGNWKPYIGVAYHIAKTDSEMKDIAAQNNGVRAAIGIIREFANSPIVLMGSMTGNVFSITIGLGGVR